MVRFCEVEFWDGGVVPQGEGCVSCTGRELKVFGNLEEGSCNTGREDLDQRISFITDRGVENMIFNG
jgi:hypothetical protein